MKHVGLLLFLFIVAHVSYGQVGIISTVNYGVDVDDFGFTLGADIDLIDRVSISPYFTYFLLPSEFNEDLFITRKNNAYTFNADLKYDFVSKDKLTVYGLVGFSHAIRQLEADSRFASIGDRFVDFSQTGTNLGAGLEGGISDRTDLLLGFKYHFPFRQPEFFMGTKINL